MRRPILFIVLSFLLLAMQHEGLVHPFEHMGFKAPRPGTAELSLPHAGGDCAEDALLAAGSHAVPGNLPALQSASPVAECAGLAFRSRAADFPASFSSRAPPVLL